MRLGKSCQGENFRGELFEKLVDGVNPIQPLTAWRRSRRISQSSGAGEEIARWGVERPLTLIIEPLFPPSSPPAENGRAGGGRIGQDGHDDECIELFQDRLEIPQSIFQEKEI